MSHAARGLSNSGDELWIWSLLYNDDALERSLRTELLSSETVEAGAYIHLVNTNLDAFWEVFGSGQISGYTSLWPFLTQAAATNQLDLFKQLFQKCPPNQTNRLLVVLVERNYPNAVVCLLKLAHAEINRQAYPENGYNLFRAGTPGLHSALLAAFDLNHQETADILLQAFPGQEIPLPVFRNIYALFQFASAAQGEILLPENLMWNEHDIRKQHPNKNGVLARMIQEAAARYPGEALEPPQIQQAQAPQVEAALPAQAVQEPIQQQPAQLEAHPGNRNSLEALFMSAALVFAASHVISPEEPGSTLFLATTLLFGLFLLDRLFTYH